SAASHVQRSRDFLLQQPNPWLEGYVEITSTNIAILQSDYRSALDSGMRAVHAAEISGSAAGLRTAYCGLGFVYYSIGEFDEAVQQFRRALALFPFAGDTRRGILDSLARISLAQGSLDECAALVSEIHAGIETSEDK